MVKPLVFKGDKKIKKRKRHDREGGGSEVRRKALQAAAEAGSGGGSGSGAEAVADDDTWVSAETVGDVAGPVMLVLPRAGDGSAGPTALACDAGGKVFAMAIENIVDGNASSAEPHDVRQVWVASRVAGTEHFRLKGHHGKYLGCDQYGLLAATAVAVSPNESFVLADAGDGHDAETFRIKTLRDTYVAAQAATRGGAVDVRGDAAADDAAAVRIRMQARFKPRLQTAKQEKARETISRRELEAAVGRRLDDDEVRLLKRARREGDYHEKLLDIKVRGKHDKFA